MTWSLPQDLSLVAVGNRDRSICVAFGMYKCTPLPSKTTHMTMETRNIGRCISYQDHVILHCHVSFRGVFSFETETYAP